MEPDTEVTLAGFVHVNRGVGGWNQVMFKVPSNPYHSMILWIFRLAENRVSHKHRYLR